MEWNYQRTENTYDEIPVGKHRVRIAGAEKAISRGGNDMLVLTLDVSGYNSRLWHYVVFMPDRPEITNRKLTEIFDSFGIADGDFNLKNWIGKVGACVTKQDEYGTKVNYFINRKKQGELPPWKEPTAKGSSPASAASATSDWSDVPADEDDLPF